MLKAAYQTYNVLRCSLNISASLKLLRLIARHVLTLLTTKPTCMCKRASKRVLGVRGKW